MKRLLLLILVLLIAAALLALLWRWVTRAGRAQRPTDARPWATGPWPLFLLPLPTALAAAISLARGHFVPMLGSTLGYGMFLAGALLVQRGLESGVTGRWPPKAMGGVLIGLATGTTAWLGVGHDPGIAAAFALVAGVGCWLTYGFEPLIRPGALGRRRTGQHARESLVRAERAIAAIDQAGREIRQPEFQARLGRIVQVARGILHRLQDDPRDLWRARKFLNVYVDGVQRVVEGYAKTHGQIAAPELDQRFQHALVTIEEAFDEQHQALLERDVEDLDLRIEVLTKQLEREGIL